jgi:hypothetical protein
MPSALAAGVARCTSDRGDVVIGVALVAFLAICGVEVAIAADRLPALGIGVVLGIAVAIAVARR